ncbi:MAG: hypothetical protein HYZ75_00785 [Elusimicrobia bacterium]|nr:hypothetical protein [Elusimicrobiota bacterium]
MRRALGPVLLLLVASSARAWPSGSSGVASHGHTSLSDGGLLGAAKGTSLTLTGQEIVKGSETVQGGGGLGVTYGVRAGSASVTGRVSVGTTTALSTFSVLGASDLNGNVTMGTLTVRGNAQFGADTIEITGSSPSNALITVYNNASINFTATTGSFYSGKATGTGPAYALTSNGLYYGHGPTPIGPDRWGLGFGLTQTTMGRYPIVWTSREVMIGQDAQKSTWTVNGNLQLSTGTIRLGSATIPSTRNAVTWLAKSQDGAAQSSGCVVAINMSGTDDSAYPTFTSTTTATTGPAMGVLMEPCAVDQYCEVAVVGLVLASCVTGSVAGQSIVTSATRCQGGSIASTGANINNGYWLTAESQNRCWAVVGGQ